MVFLTDIEPCSNFAEKFKSCFQMEKKKHIGQLIEDEVRRQQIPIMEFAEKIMCGRQNVYKIFDKSSIHLDQLAKIARVLNRNFFMELATEPSLIDIDSEEAIQEMENRRAVSQFMEVVPKVLSKLGKQPIIAFGIPLGMEYVEDLPDFMLTEYNVTFTKGSFLCEKPSVASNRFLRINAYESRDGIKVYSLINRPFGNRMIDIKLDYKTEEEWEKTLKYIFDTFFDNHE